jgi:hypothetical protein
MILATIGQIITQAQAEYEAKHARRPAPEEAAPAEVPPILAAPAEVAPPAA